MSDRILVHRIAVFALIEALAEAIANDILSRFPTIARANVRIDKPSAPVAAVIDGVSVEITRLRGEIVR